MEKVIIVLGGGIEADGSLPEIPKKRVEKGVQLFSELTALKIIMSGKCGLRLDWQKNIPSKSEAIAMKEYALTLGMKAETIVTEEDSMDTLGNAFFTKVNILEPNDWTDIVVVTSDYHLERTKFMFDLVLGPKYIIGYESAQTGLSAELTSNLFEKEKKILSVFKEILGDGLSAGDTEAIRNIMYSKHPGYATNPTYSYEVFFEMLK